MRKPQENEHILPTDDENNLQNRDRNFQNQEQREQCEINRRHFVKLGPTIDGISREEAETKIRSYKTYDWGL